MNGIECLLDTNAILYYLSGNACMMEYISERFVFSIISEMELLSFSSLEPKDEKTIKAFLSAGRRIDISEKVKECAINIRKRYKSKRPDAIIAATAIVCDIPLITADVGFKKISELKLKLINPGEV
jgi:predicted nucleic acid-binding protein